MSIAEMKQERYIDELIEIADSMTYMDYCRLLTVIYWNL